MTTIKEYTPYEANEYLRTNSSVLFIDVRSELKFNLLHMVGSINVPYSQEQFSNSIKKLVPVNKGIIVILDEMGAWKNIYLEFTKLGHHVLGYLDWSKSDQKLFPKESLSEITPEELDKLSYSDENPIIIDVRNPDEWAKEHIPNTMNIPLLELENKLDEIPKGREIVTVCGVGGGRSSTAYSLLKKHGFNQTKLLKGGIRAWKNEELPVE